MSRECLDTRLRTDPSWLALKKFKPRLFVRAEDLMLFVQRWQPHDVARFTPEVFAANLDYRSVKQFEKDLAELRERGLLEEDSYEPQFCDQPMTEEEARRQYETIRKRLYRAKSEIVSQESWDNPGTVPGTEHNGYGTVTVNGSVSLETNGNGTVTAGGVEGERLTPQAESVSPQDAPQVTPQALRIEVPQSLREELIAVGFTAEDASWRVGKHSADRIRDALDEMHYRKAKSGIKKTPDAFIASFLDSDFTPKPWQVSKAVEREREQSQQQRMPMISTVTGGAPLQVVPTGAKLSKMAPPCQTPPPVGWRDKKTGTSP